MPPPTSCTPAASRQADIKKAPACIPAAHCPRLAAALASGSALGRMLQVAEQLAGAGDEEAAQASMLLASWDALAHALVDAVTHAGGGKPDMADRRVAELQAAAAALHEQHQQLLSQLGPNASPAEVATQLQQLLQPARRLAGLALDCLHSPEVDRERQLALARAAATRSCAYLRCANVAGQGGTAAGQGVGSMRCSACRAVWYCGTACSHADWRAGHKRVCKALAAERQAAKAARAAAAAAAAAVAASS